MINQKIGKRIRSFRKKRGLTLKELGLLINKSESTISKYEKGEISIDMETFYEISEALNVQVTQLIYLPNTVKELAEQDMKPTFFEDLSIIYSYLFDGRSNQIIKSIIEVLPSSIKEEGHNVYMYMNFKDYNDYQNCETTFKGTMTHHDAITNIQLINVDTDMEQANAKILASYLNSETKWGLFNGLSSRPIMPIAVKMLFSKKILSENDILLNELKVSREDIRTLKLFNMLVVT